MLLKEDSSRQTGLFLGGLVVGFFSPHVKTKTPKWGGVGGVVEISWHVLTEAS